MFATRHSKNSGIRGTSPDPLTSSSRSSSYSSVVSNGGNTPTIDPNNGRNKFFKGDGNKKGTAGYGAAGAAGNDKTPGRHTMYYNE